MKPSALAFTFSRAKEGILRAKLAVLINKGLLSRGATNCRRTFGSYRNFGSYP